ncbi:hypothetical protein Bhyg_16458, partial [Pseudolycoriella hygida]
MNRKFFVTLLVTLFVQLLPTYSQLTIPPKECIPPKVCPKIICTDGFATKIDSNGCPGCEQCLEKPVKLCKPMFCEGVLCPIGTSSELTILPDGCIGCRICVKCRPPLCPAIACINSTPTQLPN